MKPPAKLREEIHDLWRKYLPVMRSRIETIERAIDALRNRRLTQDLQAEAAREAHKLAGSLGTFGLQSGSDAASEIERLISESVSDSAATKTLDRHLDEIKRQIAHK